MQNSIQSPKYEFSIEPVGAAGPRFSTESHLQAFVKEAGTSFSLLCPAQSFPPANFM